MSNFWIGFCLVLATYWTGWYFGYRFGRRTLVVPSQIRGNET